MNAKIVIASRNIGRSEQAVAKIKQLSHNNDIHCLQLDLGSTQSVNEFVEKFKQEFPVLDILINNSGISPVSYSESKDGMESCVQVNHLSPFLLTLKLVEVLEKAESPRIVNVSSRGKYRLKLLIVI
jgi:NAD(P)-dependent dehydrogenase (short-subunit alcohol dehydrogenase family)